ncbi:MAG: DUF971 domain-containing protein [Chloroflexi bacterium]|nr:DUF971 domain-containing protein [Chloroflexota bacterium]
MTTMPKPTSITADRKKAELTIVWEDGHESVYSFSLLRHACPCAECAGGHENMRRDPDPVVFYLPTEDSPRTHIKAIDPVGNYGINIIWEDGHHYGIYNWGYLRKLCPCEVCQREREAKGLVPDEETIAREIERRMNPPKPQLKMEFKL